MSASQHLTRGERAAVLNLAFASACTANGITKSAQAKGGGFLGGLAALLQTAAAVSIVAGVPIGTAWHMLDRSNKVTSNVERDKLKGIEYYRNAAKGLEQRLADNRFRT